MGDAILDQHFSHQIGYKAKNKTGNRGFSKQPRLPVLFWPHFLMKLCQYFNDS